MTWNLWWRFGPWEERQRAILDTLRESVPDVLCLQEVWTDADGGLDEIIGAELGYHVVTSASIGRSDVGFSNAVLSRWPATPLADEVLPGADGAPGHRRVVAASLDTPWGAWPVASTHFDHRFDGSATRQRQALRLLELAAAWRGDPTTDLPVIVGGDLNAVPDSDEIRTITGRRAGVPGIVFSDAWEQAGDGDGATWRDDNPYCASSAWPNRRIDYLLVSWPRPKPTGNPIRTWLAGVGGRNGGGGSLWPSDHAAVVAELVTPAV